MLFTELRFALFFALAFGVHWALRGNAWRKSWLLLCSYAFYGAWDPRFLLLIFGSSLLDFTAGRMMAREQAPAGRRTWLILSLVGNLGALGFFKYADFFVESAAAGLQALGVPFEPGALNVVLPVGISFFTFQTLSYTIDVYRRQLDPIDDFRDFALFVGFFPQLVAGPIVRARDFLPQLTERRVFADVPFRSIAGLFLVGFIKKACVADHAAAAADVVFANPEAYSGAGQLLAAALYTVQIYCDFSGYSDMAIATAGALGYRLCENFDYPYSARSVTEFWRRWHISLSSWFRDYLYIPLGGNRVGTARTLGNLSTVFLLCGLWHGASWTFVVWGAYHGALLIAERVGGSRTLAALPGPLATAWTMLCVTVGWIVFRAETFDVALTMLGGILTWSTDATESLGEEWWILIGAFAVFHALGARKLGAAWIRRVPDPLFAFGWGAAFALALPWVKMGYTPFIYFQF